MVVRQYSDVIGLIVVVNPLVHRPVGTTDFAGPVGRSVVADMYLEVFVALGEKGIQGLSTNGFRRCIPAFLCLSMVFGRT